VDRETWEWKPEVFTAPPGPYEEVRPGDDVGGLVGGSPAGTVFLFKSGLYERVSLQVKDQMVFVAEPGVVFDGLGEVAFAFYGEASGVTIRGFVVEQYASEFQQSAIGMGGGTAWVIEGNEVRNNTSGGIHLQAGGSSVVRDNYVHHNGQIGIKGTGTGHLVEGNEIAHNNTAGHPWSRGTAEAGGTKFYVTTDLVVRDNYVHDNDGPGLWTDGSNRNALIAGNLVEKNTGPGIFHEISYSAIITDNKVYQNQHVGIWISASSDVEVKNNEVVDNHNGGIAASQDDRSLDGDHHIENLWVHDNYIQMVTPNDDFWGWNGLQQQVGDDTYFTTRNNRWDDNTYRIPTGLDQPFKWMNGRNTIEQWNDHGQDTNATFN
jgi:parallel beta-helix repeat protein